MADVDQDSSLKNALVGGAVVVALGLARLVWRDGPDGGCTVTASGVAIIAPRRDTRPGDGADRCRRHRGGCRARTLPRALSRN